MYITLTTIKHRNPQYISKNIHGWKASNYNNKIKLHDNNKKKNKQYIDNSNYVHINSK